MPRSTAGRASAIIKALKTDQPKSSRELADKCNEVRAEGYGIWTPSDLMATLKRLVKEGRIERVEYTKGSTYAKYQLTKRIEN